MSQNHDSYQQYLQFLLGICSFNIKLKTIFPSNSLDIFCRNLVQFLRLAFRQKMRPVGGEKTSLIFGVLCVAVPPRVRSKPADGKIVIKKGVEVMLECIASGNPVPKVTWTREVRFHTLPYARVAID